MINHRIAAHRSTAIMMRSYAIGLLQQLETCQTGADEPLAARVLGDTILTCYSAEFETDRRRNNSWSSVQRFVESNLEDPALRPGYICEKLRLSAKSLQSVFRSQGTSCHKYISDARLDEAGRRLSDPSLSARITDIAYDVGFDDLSYFSRSFRRKFGVSAREYRHSALRGTLPLWRGRPSS
jgi:AraC-like DNA-binding protein